MTQGIKSDTVARRLDIHVVFYSLRSAIIQPDSQQCSANSLTETTLSETSCRFRRLDAVGVHAQSESFHLESFSPAVPPWGASPPFIHSHFYFFFLLFFALQLQMLGYDVSWAAFNIVEVMSSSKFTYKVRPSRHELQFKHHSLSQSSGN